MSKPKEIISTEKTYTAEEYDAVAEELRSLKSAVLGTFLEAQRQRTRWSKLLIPELLHLGYIERDYAIGPVGPFKADHLIVDDEISLAVKFCEEEYPHAWRRS